jgi:hypothetical protein
MADDRINQLGFCKCCGFKQASAEIAFHHELCHTVWLLLASVRSLRQRVDRLEQKR